MKETYELMEIDVREIPEEDVITVSGVSTSSEHDNGFIDFGDFADIF